MKIVFTARKFYKNKWVQKIAFECFPFMCKPIQSMNNLKKITEV